jgi:capsular polysaccharide biosynthesis protein
MRAVLTTAFWRRAVVWVLVGVLIGGAAGGVAAQLLPRSYHSTAQVFVSAPPGTTTLLEAQRVLQEVAASYASVATTPLVLRRVIDRLGLRTTPAELAKHVSADVVADTVIIEITVSDPSAARSARIANAFGAALVSESRLLTPSGGSSPQARLTSIAVARASDATPLLAFVGFGALGGLVVALVVLILRSGRPKPPRGSWRLVWTPRPPGEPA